MDIVLLVFVPSIVEGKFEGEDGMHHRSETVDVTCGTTLRLIIQEFGREVASRAHHWRVSVTSLRLQAGKLHGGSEVSQLAISGLTIDKHVLQLDILMHDVARMKHREGLRKL